MKLSDYVASFIASAGVKHVFMLTGGGAMHLNDSIGACRDLDYVCNLHEQACAIAAEAYAKVTNNLGVALVTTGPGGTNAVTGVAGAWLDSTPCLFVSGQVKRADLKGTLGVRQLGVQEVDIVSIVKPITKYAATILDPNTIRYHLEKAVFLARSGRPGPVWIDIPLDVQAATIDPNQLTPFTSQEHPPVFDAQRMQRQIREVIDILNRSDRPVLVAGNGIRLAGGQPDLLRLIDHLGIPVLVATSLGIDLVPDDHPLFFGRPGPIASRGANFTLQNCDLLVTVGARLDMAMTGYAHEKLARGAKKVMVDIDPAELAKMRTPFDIQIQADARHFLQEMIRHLEAVKNVDRSEWVGRCRQWRNKYPIVLPEHRQQETPVSTYYFSEVLSEELTGEDIVTSGSSGNAVELFHLVYKAKLGQRVIHTRSLGAMGFGIPAAIGACLAANGRRTLCVDGDGGFQLNIQELETVSRLDLPIKFFVINNDGYASIRISQQGYFKRLAGADARSKMTLPNLERVAAAYGLATIRLEHQRDLRQQIRRILQSPGPVVCEVVVPPDEPRAPRMMSVQRPDGSMVSRPLEDLWPFLDRDEFRANMIVPPLED
jgi:acetolactate synthase-1/2/3 large subunit